MGKPFEIIYSPANWTAPAGGVATSWTSPYGGLDAQTPPNLIDPSQTPDMNNFMFRNSVLQTRPNFRTLFPGPDNNNTILGIGSFLSRMGVWHTFCFTINGLYQLLFGAVAKVNQGLNPWVLVGGPALNPSNYVRWRVFQNVLYYTNGNGHLSAWDGAALTPIKDAAFLGSSGNGLPPTTTTLIGALYLGELDNHLIMAYTTETPVTAGIPGATASFSQRIRWSNSGYNLYGAGAFGSNLGTQGATFDPTLNVNSGQDDFLDVPDVITGIMFIGRTGYVFRQNGITELSPTGNGVAPFDVNHLWASEQGIGNIYPASLAQYGDHGIFVSTDNIYQLTPSQLSPIGAGARDNIMSDLATTFSPPTAIITPAFNLGYVYLAYQLYIALPNGSTRVYTYGIEDQNWAAWTISNATVGLPYKCWIGDQPVLTSTQQIVVNGQSGGGGGGGIGGGGGGGGGFGKGPKGGVNPN